jgi:hypothetical protein
MAVTPRRKPPSEPSVTELEAALRAFQETKDAVQVAHEAHMKARVKLTEMLQAYGLERIVL